MIGYDVSVRPSSGTDCCRERRERERDSVRDGKGVSRVCFEKRESVSRQAMVLFQ